MKPKFVANITLVVDVDVYSDDLVEGSLDALMAGIKDEWVKVKSGIYENMIMGVVTEVKQTTPRKLKG